MRRAVARHPGTGTKPIFDAILIDEAQDFPTSFFRTIYSVVPTPRRIIWAYDDLQNLGDYEMPSERELFGSGEDGLPLVKFILENFYFDVWRSQAVIRELAFSHEEDCMSDHDRSRAYLHWTHR